MNERNNQEHEKKLEQITPTAINVRERSAGTSVGTGFDFLTSASAYTIGGDTTNRKITISENELYQKNNQCNDILSFIKKVSMCTAKTYNDGQECYVVDSKTAGVLSIGPSIVLKYNGEYFKKYGYDVNTLVEGDTIPVSIINKVTNDILEDKRKYVIGVLKNNNIEGLTDNQIDALVSRAYSVGNISDFPSAYKQFGNTEELYQKYLSTVNGAGTIYEKELTARRNAEVELFKNGYQNDGNKQGVTDPIANYFEDLKNRGIDISEQTDSSEEPLKEGIKDPMAEYIETAKINNIDISEQTDSSKEPLKESIKDPMAEYLASLKNSGIDISDQTDSSMETKVQSPQTGDNYNDPIVSGPRIINRNYTEADINIVVNILWHEFGGSLSGNFQKDCFTLLNLACTIVNNSYAYGGAGSGKSMAQAIRDAVTLKPELYEGGQSYIYGDFNPSSVGAPESTINLLRAVAEKALSGEYSLPSNMRGQSARYIMNGYSNFDKNSENYGEHYLVDKAWYSLQDKDFVIYPLNEGKPNDKTIFTTEISDFDVFGNKIINKNVKAYEIYANQISVDILNSLK